MEVTLSVIEVRSVSWSSVGVPNIGALWGFSWFPKGSLGRSVTVGLEKLSDKSLEGSRRFGLAVLKVAK